MAIQRYDWTAWSSDVEYRPDPHGLAQEIRCSSISGLLGRIGFDLRSLLYEPRGSRSFRITARHPESNQSVPLYEHDDMIPDADMIPDVEQIGTGIYRTLESLAGKTTAIQHLPFQEAVRVALRGSVHAHAIDALENDPDAQVLLASSESPSPPDACVDSRQVKSWLEKEGWRCLEYSKNSTRESWHLDADTIIRDFTDLVDKHEDWQYFFRVNKQDLWRPSIFFYRKKELREETDDEDLSHTRNIAEKLEQCLWPNLSRPRRITMVPGTPYESTDLEYMGDCPIEIDATHEEMPFDRDSISRYRNFFRERDDDKSEFVLYIDAGVGVDSFTISVYRRKKNARIR